MHVNKIGNFTSKRIKLYSGVSSIHDRTVRRVLSKYGSHYGQATCKRKQHANRKQLETTYEICERHKKVLWRWVVVV